MGGSREDTSEEDATLLRDSVDIPGHSLFIRFLLSVFFCVGLWIYSLFYMRGLVRRGGALEPDCRLRTAGIISSEQHESFKPLNTDGEEHELLGGGCGPEKVKL